MRDKGLILSKEEFMIDAISTIEEKIKKVIKSVEKRLIETLIEDISIIIIVEIKDLMM